uniref:Uncharacterized protein n=1 Tax=Fagus sylvatica TaxID=28930 RepID=A0A2N9HG23_FAGSY
MSNHKFRFETWDGHQADSFPIRLRFEGWVDQTDSDPNHKFRFETWMDQADSFPIRLRFEGWVDQTDSDPNHKFRFEDLGGPGPIRSRFISVSRAGWTRPIRTLNHKFRFETWVDQADSFPIRLRFEGWDGPDRFGPESQISFRDLGAHPGRFISNSSPV